MCFDNVTTYYPIFVFAASLVPVISPITFPVVAVGRAPATIPIVATAYAPIVKVVAFDRVDLTNKVGWVSTLDRYIFP